LGWYLYHADQVGDFCIFVLAQYFLSVDRCLPSGGLSPISRKQGGDLTVKGPSMTFDEVRTLYGLVRTFVTSVASRWRQACNSLNRPDGGRL
jgi:hypothetical protein